ncbi:MAG: glucans biosynthesis glucosyltransferase MdoH [Roseinatronobacter sp.]
MSVPRLWGLAGLISAGLTVLLARGLALEATHPALSGLILLLFALSAAVLAFAALTAFAGVRPVSAHVGQADVPGPPGPCAILWLLCGEPPEPVADRVRAMLADLAATGQAQACQIFILSDTRGAQAVAAERAAFAGLAGQVIYRNRTAPVGRKPGNLQDWVDQHGAGYDCALILDADSGFSAALLARFRARMAADPRLGLIQAGLRLRPAQSRFGRMQRLSARLSGPVFARGLAGLSGDAGNFWGHNAVVRVRAFASVTPLPHLPGRAPMGGPILSHDFVEAAFLRRAGWRVVLSPDDLGSHEDTPETIAAHLRRDRRWAQGNLQHLRLIPAPGLNLTSRFHLIAGVLSYLAAPIWLVLVLLTGSGAVHGTAAVLWPLSGVLALLLAPKLAGLLARRAALRHPWRRRVLMRASLTELGLTTLFAPLGMVRRTGFVLSVALGRAADWVPSGQPTRADRPATGAAALAGAGIVLAVAAPQALIAGQGAALVAGLLVLPVTLPLLCAPWLWPWFDTVARGHALRRSGGADADPEESAVAQYYDRSTRRFLRVGGSGAALAIHRPLWAEGIATLPEASAHINDLIAQDALEALGAPPMRVVDLGCGVGGTLFHLAQHWPQAHLTGVTISPAQAQIGAQIAAARGLQGRCQILQSDFLLPMTLPPADLVIAVESHVHAPSAAAFLQAAVRHLSPGGVLVVVDDMLAAPESALDAPARARLAAFRRGWQLGHVPDAAGLAAQAQALGLEPVAARDLTPLLRLGRLRDRALRLAGPLADALGLAQLPLFGNMIGGNALTESYRAGTMRYRALVLRRCADALAAPVLIPTQEVAA